MKFYIRSTTNLGKTNEHIEDKEIKDFDTALKERKSGEKIVICRHDEGLPCSLV